MKNYKIPKDKILPLALNYGGCICTDKVTIEGLPILYMYKDEPANDMDSGWRFFSGLEDDNYMLDSSKHSVYDVNTIANYEISIIPFLDYPVGSEFERDGKDDDFVLIENE